MNFVRKTINPSVSLRKSKTQYENLFDKVGLCISIGDIPSFLFPSGFPTKIFKHSDFNMLSVYNPFPLLLLSIVIFDEEYILWSW
jgi:hypothetical protein